MKGDADVAGDTPAIITVGLTCSRISKRQSPAIPITLGEIARSGIEDWHDGASVVQVHVRDAASAVDKLHCDATWSVIGIRRAQPQMAMMAMPIAGHVRVGLEDNIHYRRGEPATGKGQLVERVVRLAAELGRPVATPAVARRLLEPAWQFANRRRVTNVAVPRTSGSVNATDGPEVWP